MAMKVYSPEFKADAVALFHSDPDLTIAQTARNLGINAETLRNWIRADRARGGISTPTSRKNLKAPPRREGIRHPPGLSGDLQLRLPPGPATQAV
ncbi:transposase [Streptomyces chiangmaiensis]